MSIFDRVYLEELFGGREYPDGTFVIDYIEDIMKAQKMFMEVVSETRSTQLFTYPVLTYSLIYKDGKFVDEETADFVAEEYARGHSFFTYISDTVDSLSSCCFEAETPILFVPPEQMKSNGGEGCFVYSDIKSAYDKYQDQIVQIYQETINEESKTCIGEWKNAKFVKAEAIQEMV